MTTEKQVVFVVNDGQHVLGVYGTKEKAQVRGLAWVEAGEVREWYRYDGAWQCHYRLAPDENWLTLRVTECEVSP